MFKIFYPDDLIRQETSGNCLKKPPNTSLISSLHGIKLTSNINSLTFMSFSSGVLWGSSVFLSSPGPSWFKQAAASGWLPPGWDSWWWRLGPDSPQSHGFFYVLLLRVPVLPHAVMSVLWLGPSEGLTLYSAR